MAHIHTEPGQHDLTVSAYIIRTDFDQPKLMLHRHKKLNMLLQFGGHVELKENPWQAMEHEVAEEAGYEFAQLKLLQPKDRMASLAGRGILHPLPFYVNTHPIETPDLEGKKHYHMDMGWVFVASEPPRLKLAEGESADILLFDRKELDELGEDQIWPGVRGICRFVLDDCFPNWERLPASS